MGSVVLQISKTLRVRSSIAMRLLAVSVVVTLVGCLATSPARYWDTASMPSYGAVRLTYKDVSGGEKVAGTVNRTEVDYLRGIVYRIGAAASQRVDKVLLSDQDQANASAGFDKSGNSVVTVTLKMLRLLQNDSDALAALIGHEVAHLVKKHGESNQQVQGAASAIGTVVGLLLGRAGVPMGGTLSDVGVQIVTSAYSRDQEREADELGIRIAHRAGFDPSGAARLFRSLEAANKTAAIPFLSTHPSSEERIANMQRLASELRR